MGALSSFLRLVRAAWVMTPSLLHWQRRDAQAGRCLAKALERLGPAYIKLGQMLATRPDIVGEDMAGALEPLQDRLPPFSDAAARAAIEQSLCRPVDALFAEFGAPVAAASIAQVHRAVTS